MTAPAVRPPASTQPAQDVSYPPRSRVTPAQRARGLKNRLPALATGIEPIDTGWRGGAYEDLFWVLGGPPSAGKTSFAVFLCHQWVSKGVPVTYVAGDEPADRIVVRCGQHIDLDRTQLERGDEDATEVLAEHLTRMPLDIVEPEDLELNTTIEQLFADLREKHPTGPVVIVLDSLQRLARRLALPGDANDAHRSRIENMLEVTDRCAKRFKVITIVITEFSRATYRSSRANTIDLAGGKDSGSIEYNCDVLQALRPVYDDPYLVRVTFSKSRPGAVTPFWLRQNPVTATYEVSRTHPAENRYLSEIEGPGAAEAEHLQPLIESTLAAIRQNPGCSTTTITKLLARKKAYVVACLRHLATAGKIVNLGDDRKAEWQARAVPVPAEADRTSP